MKLIFVAALACGLTATAHAAPAATPMEPDGPGPFNIDANHDGYITRSEARDAADALFKRLDKNGDGKLTREEAMHPGPWRGDKAPDGKAPEDKAPDAGDGPPPPHAEGGPWDRGGPGRWGRGPRMMAMARHEVLERKMENLFDEYDRNKDGVIEPSEFRAWAMARFDALDGNHDGKVKAPERMGPRPGMGPGRWGPHKWGPKEEQPPGPPDGAPPPPKP